VKDFTQLADLASERLGGRVLAASDDLFAPKENLLKESKPLFIEGKYTSRGKWMDGWESRRRRTPGHDWCILRLGLRGIIRGLLVDTSFFTGNYPERFSLEGCDLGAAPRGKAEKKKLQSANTRWIPVFPETPLKGDFHNLFAVNNEICFTHLRLRIYPDGGVARLRAYGEAVADARRIGGREIDLASVVNGGSVITSSDQFYGAPRNLLMPYGAKNMGDGWETKRRRGPGHDWVILKLGIPGTVRRMEVDTAHFKGNFPDSCSLEACQAGDSTVDSANFASQQWEEVLPQSKLRANHRHVFGGLKLANAVTHVRFHIYPDGGVSRLRLFGRGSVTANPANALTLFNQLPAQKALKVLLDCCGSRKWAEQMEAQRPFATPSDLLELADKTCSALGPEDWLEAFRHHPPIGETRAKAKPSAIARRWSAGEQSAAQAAAPEALAALSVENKAYSRKFGFVFLICATGRSTGDILNSLRQRMPHSPETELRIAAGEQRKITRLRLEKLLFT
jgi:allantoicase